MIEIRPYKESDARAVLEVHRTAVLVTAAQDYELNVLEEWSPPVDNGRLEKFKRENSADVRIVADINGAVVGFGELVTKESLLGACYIHPEFGGQGIGSKILSRLEEIALEKGLTYLFMDSSITAERFYNSHGYKTLEYGEHSLRSGRKMACVKMRKELLL